MLRHDHVFAGNIVARAHATAVCDRSVELVAQSTATRAWVRSSRGASPLRRQLRLGAGSSDGELPLEHPETYTRCCPSCGSTAVKPVGRVTAEIGKIKAHHRCESCRTAFVIVRKPRV